MMMIEQYIMRLSAKILARYWWYRKKVITAYHDGRQWLAAVVRRLPLVRVSWGRSLRVVVERPVAGKSSVSSKSRTQPKRRQVIFAQPQMAKPVVFHKTDTYRVRHRFSEWWRTWKRWCHRLRHRKSFIRRANQRRINRYLARNRLVTVRRRQTATGVQIFWGVASFTVSFGILFGSWWFYEHIVVDLPDMRLLTDAKQNMTTKIYDRNDHLLFEIYEDENRTPVALLEVAPDLIHATIAIEDRTFYEHKGFDLKAIVRAFRANQETGSLSQGGSTITQQLVKQRLLSSEKTFTRKIKELILAVLVEGNYSKNQILEMYLNQVNYGGAVYGIEQASITFFGKNAKDLTLSESAFLAGLPQAPSRYSPFAGNLDSSYARRSEVLRRMAEDGYISEEQRRQADNEVLAFNTSRVKIEAPHFVMYVRELLAEKYGEELVNTGGLVVRTSLDLELQNQVQQIVTDEVDSLARLRVSNGAAMVVRPGTGEILAMVGSRDYFDFDHDGQVNVAFRLRQPGSSIKPLNYATAMEYYGYTPATLILDQPVSYKAAGAPAYTPKNYDGSFHGNVTLRDSLANSYNIPSVKVLNDIGIDAMIDQGEKMGITTWTDRGRYGLALALGSGEVYMTEMMQLYGTFANYGVTVKEDPFLEIRDYKGNTIYKNECAVDGVCNKRERRTLSAATAYQISNILSDNRARTPAFGANSVLHIPGQEVAVKTGTTNSLRDNWTFGYTRDYVVGTWVGNNDNSPMSYVASGITGASPIWQKIMLRLLDSDQPSHFEVPADVVKIAYCGREEYFREGAVPAREVCRVVKPVTADASGNPGEDGQPVTN